MSNFSLLMACIFLGIGLRASRRFPDAAPATLNAFIIHISLPALIVLQIHSVALRPELLLSVAMPWLMFGFAVGFFYGLSRWFNFSRATTGALMLSGGRPRQSYATHSDHLAESSDHYRAIGEPCIAFSAVLAKVATRGRPTKGKLRWLPSTAQLRSRISANDGSVVGRLKQASFDHLVGKRNSVGLFRLPAIMATSIFTTPSIVRHIVEPPNHPWRR